MGLSLVPLNMKATVYKFSGFDEWGQSLLINPKTYKCNVTYNVDINEISASDGYAERMSAIFIFKGQVDVVTGDYIKFTTANGDTKEHLVYDVVFMQDWRGKTVHTKVVAGNGKR